MRLADALFRGGHLSEQALVEICMTGDRPVHLDRCDLCAERAVELGRWLDDVRATGLAVADAAFPPERLAAQQAQVLRRLEQLDQPSRVIAFPSQYRLDERHHAGRRVAPAWVGVGVAAGLLVGLIGGQMTARLGMAGPSVVPSSANAAPGTEVLAPQTASVDWSRIQQRDQEEDRPRLLTLDAMDLMTPRLIDEPAPVMASFPTAPRSGGGR